MNFSFIYDLLLVTGIVIDALFGAFVVGLYLGQKRKKQTVKRHPASPAPSQNKSNDARLNIIIT